MQKALETALISEAPPTELDYLLDPQTGEEVRDEYLLELQQPIKRILDEVAEDIAEGNIPLIIGDDASGRVPALIFRNVISSVYEQEGKSIRPATFFINGPGGGRPESLDKDRRRIDDITNNLNAWIKARDVHWGPNSKALIVTETINTGRSVMPVVRALQELDKKCIVASIGIESSNKESVEDIQKDLNTNVYVGMMGTPKIYNSPAYSGVISPGRGHRDLSLSFKAHPATPLTADSYTYRHVPRYLRPVRQQWINEVRRQSSILSNVIVADFDNNHIGEH